MAPLLTGVEKFCFRHRRPLCGKWCVAGNVARTIKKPCVAPAGSTRAPSIRPFRNVSCLLISIFLGAVRPTCKNSLDELISLRVVLSRPHFPSTKSRLSFLKECAFGFTRQFTKSTLKTRSRPTIAGKELPPSACVCAASGALIC